MHRSSLRLHVEDHPAHLSPHYSDRRRVPNGGTTQPVPAPVMNHSCIHYWLAIQWDDTWNICVRGRRGRGETLTREKQELLLSIALCVCPLTCQRSPHPTHPPYDASVSFFVRYTTTLNDYAESLQWFRLPINKEQRPSRHTFDLLSRPHSHSHSETHTHTHSPRRRHHGSLSVTPSFSVTPPCLLLVHSPPSSRIECQPPTHLPPPSSPTTDGVEVKTDAQPTSHHSGAVR